MENDKSMMRDFYIVYKDPIKAGFYEPDSDDFFITCKKEDVLNAIRGNMFIHHIPPLVIKKIKEKITEEEKV